MLKYYKALDIPYDAPLPVIKQAYRDLVKIWHPDRFARDERLAKRATEKLIELNEAYRVLCSFTPESELYKRGFTPAGEPIDWSMPSAAWQEELEPSEPEPERPPRASHPRSMIYADKPARMHWAYGVVGIPLVGMAIVVLISSRNPRPAYVSMPLPPPITEVSEHYDADSPSLSVSNPGSASQYLNASNDRSYAAADSLKQSPKDSIRTHIH